MDLFAFPIEILKVEILGKMTPKETANLAISCREMRALLNEMLLHRVYISDQKPIICATSNGFLACMPTILADPNLDINEVHKYGTALHYAATYGTVDCMKLILAHPNVNVNSLDHRNHTL